MQALRNLLSLRSIGTKLAIMTVVGAICMALVASTVLWIARAQLVTERTEKAHAVVDTVWNLADGYYKAYKAGQMTEEEAKKRFLEANNYVWYEGPRQLRLYL
jgi:methyl-accepting chemotaxis protein